MSNAISTQNTMLPVLFFGFVVFIFLFFVVRPGGNRFMGLVGGGGWVLAFLGFFYVFVGFFFRFLVVGGATFC